MRYNAKINSFLTTLEHIKYGSIYLTMPDGKKQHYHGKCPGNTVTFYIHDWRCISMMAIKGDIGFAESYYYSLWDTDNLPNLLIFALQNEHIFSRYIYGNLLFCFISQCRYFLKQNTKNGSKRNIHKHYDLGNDFYALWLDPSMTYSSAIFTDTQESLEQAQYNKYKRILTRLGEKKGELLEIGTGWGGFAEYAATYHHDITSITLSKQQYNYAKQRLGPRANIMQKDYRSKLGQYDYIVSIEMFEAVGERFWPIYFKQIKSCLKETGKCIIQTITINKDYAEHYKKGGDMIRSFIFPGGMLPTIQEFKKATEKANLSIENQFTFGTSYAKTLTHWLNNFEEKLPQIRALGFDDAFIRIWRLYLSACFASFITKRTDVMQLELKHP